MMTQMTPESNTLVIAAAVVVGLGFGGPLILIIAACQLCTPPELIATATALIVSLHISHSFLDRN